MEAELGAAQDVKLVYTCVVLLLVALLVRARRNQPDLTSIPTIGPAGFLVSYIGAVKFLLDARKMLQEGYEKHKLSAFKVANLSRWAVVVTGPRLIEELRKAPDDEMSFMEAANEMVQIPYTLGAGIATDPYHVAILGTQLTRNMNIIFPEIRQEMIAAFQDIIPTHDGSEWTQVSAVHAVMQVVSRVSNRIFVGPTLCRNPDFTGLNIQFSREVLTGAIIVSMFPKFLRPIAARVFTSLPRSIKRMHKYLQPIIEERQQKMDLYGRDYPHKANDLLSWLMSEAEGTQREPRDLTLRILAVNFAATHTSSMSFTHALYHLAAGPEFVQPMRDEIEYVVKQEGWTKAAMDRMRKVDSFLKESMRYSGLRALSMMRKAVKPFTFSDGTHIPAGTFVFAAATPAHFDPAHYAEPDKFDAFRFAKLEQAQQQEGLGGGDNGGGSRHQMVTTTSDYLAWGYGRRACPGRFFAAVELKLMLAHIVMHYDVRFEDVPGGRPADLWIEANCLPNLGATVMFRKRRKSEQTARRNQMV